VGVIGDDSQGVTMFFLRCVWFLLGLSAVLLSGDAQISGAPASADLPVKAIRPRVVDPLMKQYRIDTTRPGLARFLRGLHPSESQRREVEALVNQLGSEKFQTREAAMWKLSKMARTPVEALKKAVLKGGPEASLRAKKLLALRKGDTSSLLYLVFKTISKRKISGLVPELIAAIPVCEQRFLVIAARDALLASSQESDIQTLRAALKHQHVQVQAAAVHAMAEVETDRKNLLATLRKMLVPPQRDDVVATAVARILADLGERESLKHLVKLLHSTDANVRSETASVLRASTGQRFGFASYSTPEMRLSVIKRWDVWVKMNGTNAKLRFPLNMERETGSHLNGNTLIAYGYKHKVVEYSPDWKTVWEYQVKGAYSAEKLKNGNYLISRNGPNEVIEVTPQKKVVWIMRLKSCINARPLANGNILVAGHIAKSVYEISRDHKIVWSYDVKGNCYDAHRLPNGNTLLATNKGVYEVTPDKNEVWSYELKQIFYGIQPLPNGNILLANYSVATGRVDEITREKKIVWTYKAKRPFDVFRLSNGNTLVTTYNEILEVTPAGKRLWTRTGNSYGRARR
jgi:hypothetical protein